MLVGRLSPSLQEAVSAAQVSLGPNVMGELCQHRSWIFNEELDDAKALLDFHEARSIGYVEFPDGAVYVQNHDQVAAYTLEAERLCAAALSSADTIKAVKSRLAKLI